MSEPSEINNRLLAPDSGLFGTSQAAFDARILLFAIGIESGEVFSDERDFGDGSFYSHYAEKSGFHTGIPLIDLLTELEFDDLVSIRESQGSLFVKLTSLGIEGCELMNRRAKTYSAPGLIDPQVQELPLWAHDQLDSIKRNFDRPYSPEIETIDEYPSQVRKLGAKIKQSSGDYTLPSELIKALEDFERKSLQLIVISNLEELHDWIDEYTQLKARTVSSSPSWFKERLTKVLDSFTENVVGFGIGVLVGRISNSIS